ncbi:MAG: helix-turn-helix domain-containing protein [Phycisphaerae bacterium]
MALIDSISATALEALQRYSWPGNVRELLNVIERAIVLAEAGKTVIHLADFPKEVQNATLAVGSTAAKGSAATTPPTKATPVALSAENGGPLHTLAELETIAIEAALARYGNNKTKAAHAIGISVRTLQRKLATRDVPQLVMLRTELEI